MPNMIADGETAAPQACIVVNADDLGIREDINQAIFDGMARGTVTSATLLANGPALSDAIRGLSRFPRCSFGVHLNLTEFQPLSPQSKNGLAAILKDGNFNGNAIREVRITPAMLRAVYREWCAQIDRLRSLGVELSHFDAHHHVHTIPQMLPVLAALSRRYGVRKIRISRNLYSPAERPGGSLLRKKWLYNSALRALGFRTTGLFTDLVTFMRECPQRAPKSRIELMTHPGSCPRDEESRLLASDWPKELSYPVRLVSYKAI
jgi:hypothetical protein